MIEALNLLWIIPLSVIFGAIGMVCFACVAINKISEEELLEAENLKKIENTKRGEN